MDSEVEDPHADPLYAGHSRTREKILETAFLADLSRMLWKQGRRDAEILRAEVDRGGYDIVVEWKGIVRHIQLKSKHRAGKAAEFKIQTALGNKPSGCVIAILYDPATLAIGPFLWFGSLPRLPLPEIGDKIARHTKGNKDGVKANRPGLRMLPLDRFVTLTTMDEVVAFLFGDLDRGGRKSEPSDGTGQSIDAVTGVDQHGGVGDVHGDDHRDRHAIGDESDILGA